MTCYSVKPGDQIFAKGYGFLAFANIFGKKLSGKYSSGMLTS